MANLNFLNGNPGSSQYGNFINYYKFHSPEERVKLLDREVWSNRENVVCLDVGCNAGDLTVSLYDFIVENVSSSCHCLALDIDPVLIQRAEETKGRRNITYMCLDFMNEQERCTTITTYLQSHNVQTFTTVFCFSITMWIHLNYGDAGLRTFLKTICDIGEIIVIESQPWKSYKSAVKRMKLSNFEFPLFKTLRIKSDVEDEIERILITECGANKVKQTERTAWGRKILFLKKSN